jgi:hypothetical protein
MFVLCFSVVISWFRPKRKSHKTLDIIVSTKYEFFKFHFGAQGGGLPPRAFPPLLWCNNICGSLEMVLLLFLRDPMTILINIIQKFQGVMMGFSPYGGQARSSHYRLLLVADKWSKINSEKLCISFLDEDALTWQNKYCIWMKKIQWDIRLCYWHDTTKCLLIS